VSETRRIVESIAGEFRRYKKLGEGAIDQVPDDQLSRTAGAAGNSLTTLVWHVSGNLESRFTDFLRSDGEKPWRDRDSEFVHRTASRVELLAKWGRGWTVLFDCLEALDDEALRATVSIRGVPSAAHEALHRSLAHVSYHVGQIVLLAKALRGDGWRYLSVPPGGTAAYNANPVAERPPGPTRKGP
jgi:hypothetical protein